MTVRGAGMALICLGAAIAVLPAFTWFSAPPGAALAHASGLEGFAPLWLLPALGLAVAAAGVAVAVGRGAPGRRGSGWAGPLAACSGLAALALAGWAAARPGVVLEVTLAGRRQELSAPISLTPAAAATIAAAALAAATGAVVTWLGWRR